MKFNVGDKVKILDGSEIENYTGGWTQRMIAHVGETHEIEGVSHEFMDGRIMYDLKGVSYSWDERGLELVEKAEEPKITVEVKTEEEKEGFLRTASEVIHDEFGDLIKECPEMMLLLGAYTAALAKELF